MKVKSEMLFFLEFCHTYTVFEEVSKQGIEEYGYKSVFNVISGSKSRRKGGAESLLAK